MWIDIRNYGWTPQIFEIISAQDPYFVEPLIDHQIYTYTRLIAGNVIFRADWFITHAMDAMQQLDEGENEIIYYRLLYDDKAPKTLAEFHALWSIDINKIREVLKVERGAVVDTGKSGVSRHNRRILGARTETGYYWSTQDSKVLDYVENIFEEKKDAGEIISSHRNGLQVYLLVNANDERVDFADNALVIDHSDPSDVRVRTAKSCIICHSGGINPVEDEIQNLIINGIKLYADKETELRIKQFYLRDLNKQITADNLLYEEAVRLCNDLDGNDNMLVYRAIYDWYISEVTLEQAAREFGLSIEELKKGAVETVSGRIAALIQYGKPIPRQIWEQRQNGAYTQIGLLLKKITLPVAAPQPVPVAPQNQIELIHNANIQLGNQVLKTCAKGEKFTILQEQKDWYMVEKDGVQGWISAQLVKRY